MGDAEWFLLRHAIPAHVPVTFAAFEQQRNWSRDGSLHHEWPALAGSHGIDEGGAPPAPAPADAAPPPVKYYPFPEPTAERPPPPPGTLYRDGTRLLAVYTPMPASSPRIRDPTTGRPGGLGCTHGKFFLLLFPGYLRVVITSANLIPHQWESCNQASERRGRGCVGGAPGCAMKHVHSPFPQPVCAHALFSSSLLVRASGRAASCS